VVLSEWGFWGEELVGPLEAFAEQGYDVDFVTPQGRRPVAIAVSMDPDYIDPPLGRPVTSPERDAKAAELVDRYDALLIVGGSGPIVDLVNNQRLHDLILAFYDADKLIGAECYGVTCLAFARNWEDRKSIISGKHVTGHCIEYDYKYGTGFMGTNFVMGPPPYPLEWILRDATAPGGAYHGNYGHETSVIVDYPFVTGRSTSDSYLTGQKMIEVLEQGLRQWGFHPTHS